MVCSPTLSSAPLVYPFESVRDQLDRLRLRLATFLPPQGELCLELYPLNGNHLLRRVVVPATAALDNAWMEVSFEPLRNLLGQTLEVRISAHLQQGKLAVYEFGQPGSTRDCRKMHCDWAAVSCPFQAIVPAGPFSAERTNEIR